MSLILDHFDALTARGLKIIPLRENSKIPVCKGWSSYWDRVAARDRLLAFPDANLGLLLGEVVDVEGDSDDANRQILDLIGDYPHPSYTSTKSIHHLFLSPDPALRHFRHGDIEFRGHGHQSVVPPSHHQGVVYRWLRPYHFPVPPMPDRLKRFYFNRQKATAPSRRHHVHAACARCGKKWFVHRKRFGLELDAFQSLGERWQCHGCRRVDLRPVCRRAHRPEAARRFLREV